MSSKHADEVKKALARIDNGHDQEENAPHSEAGSQEPEAGNQEPVKDIYVLFVREEDESEQGIIDSTVSDPDTTPLWAGQARPSLAPVILAVIALSLLIAIGVLTPYRQPDQRASIRVPAVLLPLKTFRVTEPVIATGVETYPAAQAHGILTLTNGSVIAQELPAGLIFTGADGAEVVTDAAVFVPAGSASGYGIAYISAHAVPVGEKGNIPALDIDSVEGSSVYIRNLSAFTGGEDARSVKFATLQDKQAALDSARGYLEGQVSQIRVILEAPCSESTAFGNMLRVTWVCRFAAYPNLPGYRITGIRIEGRNLLVDVVFVVRPRPFPGK